MRLHKLLFVIFLALFLIAGLSLLITGSVAHRHASQFAEITGHSIMSGAGFIIALGVFVIIFAILGFIGAFKNRLQLLQIFIGALFVILLLELIAVIVGFTLRAKADTQLHNALKGSMPAYVANNREVMAEWDRLQQTWSCCGVDGPDDWKNLNKAGPPASCCPNNVCPPSAQNSTAYFTTGCYSSARTLFYRYSKALGGVSLFFFFVEIVGLILGIVLLRDLKNNYGSV